MCRISHSSTLESAIGSGRLLTRPLRANQISVRCQAKRALHMQEDYDLSNSSTRNVSNHIFKEKFPSWRNADG